MGEVTPVVKSEPQPHYTIPEHSLATYQEEDPAQYEEDYGAYEDDDTSGYEGGLQNTGTHTKDYQDIQDPEELYQFVVQCQEVAGSFICSICHRFKAVRKGLVRNHVESIHFKGVFRYCCQVCNKEFQGRNALAVHNSSLHPTRPRGFQKL